MDIASRLNDVLIICEDIEDERIENEVDLEEEYLEESYVNEDDMEEVDLVELEDEGVPVIDYDDYVAMMDEGHIDDWENLDEAGMGPEKTRERFRQGTARAAAAERSPSGARPSFPHKAYYKGAGGYNSSAAERGDRENLTRSMAKRKAADQRDAPGALRGKITARGQMQVGKRQGSGAYQGKAKGIARLKQAFKGSGTSSKMGGKKGLGGVVPKKVFGRSNPNYHEDVNEGYSPAQRKALKRQAKLDSKSTRGKLHARAKARMVGDRRSGPGAKRLRMGSGKKLDGRKLDFATPTSTNPRAFSGSPQNQPPNPNRPVRAGTGSSKMGSQGSFGELKSKSMQYRHQSGGGTKMSGPGAHEYRRGLQSSGKRSNTGPTVGSTKRSGQNPAEKWNSPGVKRKGKVAPKMVFGRPNPNYHEDVSEGSGFRDRANARRSESNARRSGRAMGSRFAGRSYRGDPLPPARGPKTMTPKPQSPPKKWAPKSRHEAPQKAHKEKLTTMDRRMQWSGREADIKKPGAMPLKAAKKKLGFGEGIMDEYGGLATSAMAKYASSSAGMKSDDRRERHILKRAHKDKPFKQRLNRMAGNKARGLKGMTARKRFVQKNVGNWPSQVFKHEDEDMGEGMIGDVLKRMKTRRQRKKPLRPSSMAKRGGSAYAQMMAKRRSVSEAGGFSALVNMKSKSKGKLMGGLRKIGVSRSAAKQLITRAGAPAKKAAKQNFKQALKTTPKPSFSKPASPRPPAAAKTTTGGGLGREGMRQAIGLSKKPNRPAPSGGPNVQGSQLKKSAGAPRFPVRQKRVQVGSKSMPRKPSKQGWTTEAIVQRILDRVSQ
jgi:hypothetical protein